MKLQCPSILALAGALLYPSMPASATETNRWSFDVTPYLWVASLETETSLPSIDFDLDAHGLLLGLGFHF